jgi:hypothetical protein
MRRIGKITGRSDDMLIIRGVNVFPSQIEELILKMPLLAPQYQLLVSRDGHLDQLEVLAELRPQAAHMLAAGSDAPARQLAGELEMRIKTNVGVTTRVRLLAPGGIELDQFLGSTSTGDRIAVRYNTAENIDGRKSDGAGGYLTFNERTSKSDGHTEAGYEDVQFVQVSNVVNNPSIEIAWNRVVNEPGMSRVRSRVR